MKDKGIGCYLQYTLNDYDNEKLEPNVPNIFERIDTYKRLVDNLGAERVIWRFDPMILTENIGINELLSKVTNIGNLLQGYTKKLVFSFADIMTYKKVARNLDLHNIKYKEWDCTAMTEFAKQLSNLNANNWKYRLATCSESINLESYGIEHNRCIDPDLISHISPNDAELQRFLIRAKHDSGQRKSCGCIISKDIGQYNTCPHLCRYCYANSTAKTALSNYQNHINNPLTDKIF